jgi:hypothetical protein
MPSYCNIKTDVCSVCPASLTTPVSLQVSCSKAYGPAPAPGTCNYYNPLQKTILSSRFFFLPCSSLKPKNSTIDPVFGRR